MLHGERRQKQTYVSPKIKTVIRQGINESQDSTADGGIIPASIQELNINNTSLLGFSNESARYLYRSSIPATLNTYVI